MAFLSPADLKDGKAEAPRDQRFWVSVPYLH